MEPVEEMFKPELGRLRTTAEVREVAEKLRPFVERYALSFHEACAQPTKVRGQAFEAHHREFPDGCDHQIALQAIDEILWELETMDAEVAKVDAFETLGPRIAAFREKTIVHHIRNARYWSVMFHSDSYIRILVFSWILGVEPDYEPLDDMTEEERAEHEQQIREIAAPIRAALERPN